MLFCFIELLVYSFLTWNLFLFLVWYDYYSSFRFYLERHLSAWPGESRAYPIHSSMYPQGLAYTFVILEKNLTQVLILSF